MILRLKEDYDGAEPSGNSVAILGLPGGLTLPEDMKQLKEMARLRDNDTKPGLISAWEIRGRELVLYWRDLAPEQIHGLFASLQSRQLCRDGDPPGGGRAHIRQLGHLLRCGRFHRPLQTTVPLNESRGVQRGDVPGQAGQGQVVWLELEHGDRLAGAEVPTLVQTRQPIGRGDLIGAQAALTRLPLRRARRPSASRRAPRSTSSRR